MPDLQSGAHAESGRRRSGGISPEGVRLSMALGREARKYSGIQVALITNPEKQKEIFRSLLDDRFSLNYRNDLLASAELL